MDIKVFNLSLRNRAKLEKYLLEQLKYMNKIVSPSKRDCYDFSH